MVSILNSSDPSVSFQASQHLLQLTRVLSSQPNSSGVRAVAGVASSWGPLAVAALLQLWDRQLSVAGHASLIMVITDHLDCLQVLTQLPAKYVDCCRKKRFMIAISSAAWSALESGLQSQLLRSQGIPHDHTSLLIILISSLLSLLYVCSALLQT